MLIIRTQMKLPHEGKSSSCTTIGAYYMRDKHNVHLARPSTTDARPFHNKQQPLIHHETGGRPSSLENSCEETTDHRITLHQGRLMAG